jgi:predicted phosphodiesterase
MINKPTKWAIVNDTQVPYHDPRAVEIAAQIIEEYNPDHLLYNGDIADFHALSKHEPRRHERANMVSFQEEVERTIVIQDKLYRANAKRIRNGKARIKRHMVDGNHEDRLERYLGTGLQSIIGNLKGLHMEEVFSYKKRGFSSYRPYGDGIWITKNLFVYHGSYVTSQPGGSVAKEVVNMGASVIMGHTHRRAEIRFKQGNHEHMGIESGCLCQLSASYAPMTNWAHAMVTVDVYDDRHWNATVHDIINDGNEVYCIYKDSKLSVPVSYDDGLTLPWRAGMEKRYDDFSG